MRTTPDPHRLGRGTVVLLLMALLGLAGAPATATPWAGAAPAVDRAEGQPTLPTSDLGATSPAARRWPRARLLVAAIGLLLGTVGARRQRRRRDPQAPGAAGRWTAVAMRGPPAMAA